MADFKNIDDIGNFGANDMANFTAKRKLYNIGTPMKKGVGTTGQFELGVNLCDDPIFETGTGWVFNAGWTNNTPLATCDNDAFPSQIFYNLAGKVTAGRKYHVTFVVDGVFAGTNARLGVGVGTTESIDTYCTKSGMFSATIVAIQDISVFLRIQNELEDDFVGTVTEVSIREVIT